MKKIEIDEIDDLSDILRCANCGYVDTARKFGKDGALKCTECRSEAIIEYKESDDEASQNWETPYWSLEQ
jgi:hypothetical protein